MINSQEQILCIIGPPGSGKSMAAESLYNELSKPDKTFGFRRRICIHLVFKMEGKAKHNKSMVISALVIQLLDQNQSLQQLAIRKIGLRRRGSQPIPPHVLQGLLNTLLEGVSETPIYFIVDAIDECDADFVQTAIDIIGSMLRWQNVRLIVTYYRENDVGIST
jgi:hypothetical protein